MKKTSNKSLKDQQPPINLENEEDGGTVQLFKEEIIVESCSAKSSQAVVFFGREATLKIRVVLKQ